LRAYTIDSTKSRMHALAPPPESTSSSVARMSGATCGCRALRGEPRISLRSSGLRSLAPLFVPGAPPDEASAKFGDGTAKGVFQGCECGAAQQFIWSVILNFVPALPK